MIKMNFKDFEFSINPGDLTVSMKKNIAKNNLPYSDASCRELGSGVTVISGKGYFVGENAIQKAMELARVYNKKGSDFLFLPMSVPIRVYFEKLDISYSSASSRVEYSFQFVEDSLGKRDSYDFGYTYAMEGESLFDVANRTGVQVEVLAKVNDFQNLFAVRDGDRVWLM